MGKVCGNDGCIWGIMLTSTGWVHVDTPRVQYHDHDAMPVRDIRMEEVFEPAPNHPLYLISSYGEVINVKTNHALAFTESTNGTDKVTLHRDGVLSSHLVHRLVAELFLEDYDPEIEVLHISEDKHDNSVLNLKMGTKKARK